jgi:UDPglucose 6-dehydrogenase
MTGHTTVGEMNTSTTVVQIGCGVVGHAYVKAYKSKNVNTICVEVSEPIIMTLKNQGFEVYKSGEVPQLKNVSFVFLCICTPFNHVTNKLDMKYLDSTLDTVAEIVAANPQAVVVIRSTINLGYTSLYQQKLSERIGGSVEVCYQPEFLRAKTAFQDAMNPWSVVIGCDNVTSSIGRLTEFYGMFLNKDKIEILSVEEAELMKVVHNSFNAAKISYFNQVYLLCNKINEKKVMTQRLTVTKC